MKEQGTGVLVGNRNDYFIFRQQLPLLSTLAGKPRGHHRKKLKRGHRLLCVER